MAYAQSRKDHEYLWAYDPADDMTGGYVDQEDLEKLLQSPTKKTATDCYDQQIGYWFSIGPDTFGTDPKWKTDKRVRAIAIRHGCEDDLDRLLKR